MRNNNTSQVVIPSGWKVFDGPIYSCGRYTALKDGKIVSGVGQSYFVRNMDAVPVIRK